MAKVGSSAKLCVPVFKASLLDYLGGGQSAKKCSSAKCCVLAFKASMLYPGGPSAKVVHLPSVVYWYSRQLFSLVGRPSIKVGSSAKYCVPEFKATIVASIQGNYSH